MSHFFQETTIGLVLHAFLGGKVMPYPEEKPDFEIPDRYRPGYKAAHYKSKKAPLAGSSASSTSVPSPDGVQSPSGDSHGSTAVSETNSNSDKDSNKHKETSEKASPTPAAANEQDADGPPTDMFDDSDPYLVDWNGPNDPDNPQNWSFRKKVGITSLICLLTLSVYMGSAIYTPGIPLLAEYFGVGTVTATLGLTLFVAGYGIGPMLGLTSMTEIPAIGRTLPYVITLALFVILQVPTALVNNIAGFMILRFLAGLVGSPPLATGGATLGDVWSPRKRALTISVWGLSAVCGPVLGPLIGGFASQSLDGIEGWRWTIWPLLFLGGFTLIVLTFLLPETSANNILVRRARRLRKVTGNPNLRSKGEIFAAGLTGKEIALMTFVRPFVLGLGEPIVLGINFHIGLVYGILYLWFEAFPIVFNEVYGFNAGEGGLAFMGIFVAAFIAYGLFALWHVYRYEPVYDKANGSPKPEIWLEVGIVGAWFIPICMFFFGWTATGSIHWIVPIIASGFFSIGTFALFQAGLSYLGDAYPEYIASVYSANDFFRSYIGAALPLVARAMFTNLQANGPKNFPVAWGCTLIGCISIVMGPIPLLLYIYGPKLRKASKYCKTFADEEESSEKRAAKA